MAIYYSKSVGGFLDGSLFSKLPADAVEIDAEKRDALIEAERSGKVIRADVSGAPVVADAVLSSADLAAAARRQRDALVSATDWLVTRHRDQVDASAPTTLTSAQYKSLLNYRQALRDLSKQRGFPATVTWPTAIYE